MIMNVLIFVQIVFCKICVEFNICPDTNIFFITKLVKKCWNLNDESISTMSKHCGYSEFDFIIEHTKKCQKSHCNDQAVLKPSLNRLGHLFYKKIKPIFKFMFKSFFKIFNFKRIC